MTDDISGGVLAWEPNLYIYDSYSGGVGLSAPLYRLCAALLTKTQELIQGCACDAGCPACVGPVGEIGERGKEVALAFLTALTAIRSQSAEPASAGYLY
jgi:DEAD/DEAH box helicase domain-containing protein